MVVECSDYLRPTPSGCSDIVFRVHLGFIEPHGKEGVARKLDDLAALMMDFVDETREVRVDVMRQKMDGKCLRQCSEPTDIDEENRSLSDIHPGNGRTGTLDEFRQNTKGHVASEGGETIVGHQLTTAKTDMDAEVLEDCIRSTVRRVWPLPKLRNQMGIDG